MEFIKRQPLQEGNDKVMSDILALLDGLTVQQAEAILNNLSIEIKKSKVNVSDIGIIESPNIYQPLGGCLRTAQDVPKQALDYFMVQGKDFNHGTQEG